MKVEKFSVPKSPFCRDVITFFNDNYDELEIFTITDSHEVDEGEWIAIENDVCRLELCLTEDSALQIRAIKVFTEGVGVARKVVEGLISFAEENEMSVQATDVEVDAESFWQRMGFEVDPNDIWHYNG